MRQLTPCVAQLQYINRLSYLYGREHYQEEELSADSHKLSSICQGNTSVTIQLSLSELFLL